MTNNYLIIYCKKCGTPQYVFHEQKTRKCPRCGYRIKVKAAKVFATADSESEANQIVRSMKTPAEIEQRMAAIKSRLKSPSSSNSQRYKLLGEIITQLLAVFPNAMPKALLVEKAAELGIDDENFITQTIDKLNRKGLVLINKDFQNNEVYKFPSVPFQFGKMFVDKPKKEIEIPRSSNWKKKPYKKSKKPLKKTQENVST